MKITKGNPSLLATTLNVNGLNSPSKRTEISRMDENIHV
jgi:hypothetical protein